MKNHHGLFPVGKSNAVCYAGHNSIKSLNRMGVTQSFHPPQTRPNLFYCAKLKGSTGRKAAQDAWEKRKTGIFISSADEMEKPDAIPSARRGPKWQDFERVVHNSLEEKHQKPVKQRFYISPETAMSIPACCSLYFLKQTKQKWK